MCNYSSEQRELSLLSTDYETGEKHGLSSWDTEHGSVQVERSCFPADRSQDAPQPYLWSYPFLSAGILGLDHALGPGSDISSTVISIALEDQLT